MKSFYLQAAMVVIFILGVGVSIASSEADEQATVAATPTPAPAPVLDSPTGDVFFGKVNVLKRKSEDKSEVVDIISFQLLGTKGQDVPPLILVFNSKEREQVAIKNNGKPMWLEGNLGFSGQRNFIYVTGVLRRE